MSSDPPQHGISQVSLVPPGAGPVSWWTAYSRALEDAGLPAESRQAVSDDASYIVENCLWQADDPRWPVSGERRGAVMGAVQSGKTASMMAVIAKALDTHVDGIVVLAGTRSALWLQTLQRVDEQLDGLPDPTTARLRVPPPGQGELVGGELGSLYSLTEQQVERATSRGRPLLAVVMKNVAHLERLSRSLHETVYPIVERRSRPFHLVVIDDEADDSSIDDPAAGPDELRQVPRRILDLWESRRSPGRTAMPWLRATYVAYTATPQANFLQDPANPLAPNDFVVALRTAGPEGDVDVRAPSFRTSRGYQSWYTGGEVFYNRFADAPLCVEAPLDACEALREGVRAFLVASAIRLLREEPAVSPTRARSAIFATRDEAKAALPNVASMLVHPSASMDAHFQVADELIGWSGGEQPADQGRHLGVDGLARDMSENPDRWLTWLRSYKASASSCVSEFGASESPFVPPQEDWGLVARIILEDVVPGTTVAVINSDERADDRPEFSPQRDDGHWRAPRNLSTIFVSGNVMSRGITLEGLSTTVFTRDADDPLADTQMQMQRWFGYRGQYIELCRVLAAPTQIDLFRRYHDNDESLRRQVIAAMSVPGAEPPNLSVLTGLDHRATGKVSDVRGRRLSPGSRPFVQQMNSPEDDARNLEVLAEVFSADVRGVPASDAQQGVLSQRLWNLDDTTTLLDRLSYPGLRAPAADYWTRIEEQLGLPAGDERLPLLRGARRGRSWVGLSPHELAAYLRTWAALLERRSPGFTTTDEPPLQWSLLDLEEKRRNAPKFRVALRFGSGEEWTAPPLGSIPFRVRPMRRTLRDGSDFLDATWGSRGDSEEGILGDEFFDFYGRNDRPRLTRSGWRAADEPGLILFHLIAREGHSPTVALGASLPAGGPDQVLALRRSIHDRV